MQELAINRINDSIVDELEVAMVGTFPIIHPPLLHLFTPGLYIRQIFMETGAIITSKIHKTQHPFTISKGCVSVSIDGMDGVDYEAGYTGITYPGTRRVLFIKDDCIWNTYHPLPFITGEENFWSEEDRLKLVSEIEDLILYAYENTLLTNKEERRLL